MVEPSAFSVVTSSSTSTCELSVATLFTVKVLLLLVVPVTVIRSYCARLPRLSVVVLEDDILYSVPVLVKLITVPLRVALCDVALTIVVLVCAMAVIYGVFLS